MTAAVEGVSQQCKEVARQMDVSFRQMVALIAQSTSQKHKAYPTPAPSSNVDSCARPEISTPTQKLQSDRIDPSSPSNAQPLIDERLIIPDGADRTDNRAESRGSATPPVRKRIIRSMTVSPYFPNSAEKKIKNTASPYFPKPLKTKPKAREKVSCIPFPPLSSTSFGLVQESLAHDPFRLLIAVIFLNKTRGSVALPVFYELMERYPTPADLAVADLDDVVDIIEHLGLQNQRAMKCINLAKAWLERPPEKGKRFRLLHYPNKDDGKDVKADEVLDEDDKRVAWEIGQLPGVGTYAIDSWRIFCRDELRGLPTGLPKEISPVAEKEEMQKEWTRVLPSDKELRAYLRWRWLRNGWEWNPVTGDRVQADETAIANAGNGGVICEGEDSGIILGDRESKHSNAMITELEIEEECKTGEGL